MLFPNLPNNTSPDYFDSGDGYYGLDSTTSVSGLFSQAELNAMLSAVLSDGEYERLLNTRPEIKFLSRVTVNEQCWLAVWLAKDPRLEVTSRYKEGTDWIDCYVTPNILHTVFNSPGGIFVTDELYTMLLQCSS